LRHRIPRCAGEVAQKHEILEMPSNTEYCITTSMAEPYIKDLRLRWIVVRGLSFVEDGVYVGLGILLAIAAATLLTIALKTVITLLFAGALQGQIVTVLDQVLLILLIIELLYTVQVSFREHGLIAEPFLVVALIAAIRRILILTAEISKLPEAGEAMFRHAVIELALLTAMVLVLVGSLIMLQRHAKKESTRLDLPNE
jgi:uncharacterized membrane protein (DUF373 family)